MLNKNMQKRLDIMHYAISNVSRFISEKFLIISTITILADENR